MAEAVRNRRRPRRRRREADRGAGGRARAGGGRRGARGAPPGADRPRYAGVGADAGGRAGGRDRAGRRRRADRRGHAHPGGVVLVRRLGLDLAVVVSASHNPWRDNGIKFFGRDGDEAARRIGGAGRGRGRNGAGPAQRARRGPRPPRRARRLSARAPRVVRRSTCAGLQVVLDCANGSTHRAAPANFERLGAEVEVLVRRPRRPQHQRGLRLDPSRGRSPSGSSRPARTWASPTTATATG